VGIEAMPGRPRAPHRAPPGPRAWPRAVGAAPPAPLASRAAAGSRVNAPARGPRAPPWPGRAARASGWPGRRREPRRLDAPARGPRAPPWPGRAARALGRATGGAGRPRLALATARTLAQPGRRGGQTMRQAAGAAASQAGRGRATR